MATAQRQNLQDTFDLEKLYDILPSTVKQKVYCTGVQSWKGQEYDISQDITQEAIVRTFLQMQKAERGEVTTVISPLYFSKKVASNYRLDLARKDTHVIRPSCDVEVQERMMVENWIDSCENVLDDMEIESLFTLIAHVIADFPNKQRIALLMDLADRTPVDEPFRPLQEALMKVNINLDMYRNCVPTSEVEKKRYSSLLSQAYKRVKLTVLAHLQTHNGDCSA